MTTFFPLSFAFFYSVTEEMCILYVFSETRNCVFHMYSDQMVRVTRFSIESINCPPRNLITSGGRNRDLKKTLNVFLGDRFQVQQLSETVWKSIPEKYHSFSEVTFPSTWCKDCLPSLPLKTRKRKKENPLLLSCQILCSLMYEYHSQTR